MIKASEFKERQYKKRKDRLEERYSKQIKEIEDLIFQAIKEDKTEINIPVVVSAELMGRRSILGLVAYSEGWEEFKALLRENGYTVSYFENDVIISWGVA